MKTHDTCHGNGSWNGIAAFIRIYRTVHFDLQFKAAIDDLVISRRPANEQQEDHGVRDQERRHDRRWYKKRGT